MLQFHLTDRVCSTAVSDGARLMVVSDVMMVFIRHRLMRDQRKRYADGKFDGLSDLSYQLHDVQLRPLYTWIHVDLNGHSSAIC